MAKHTTTIVGAGWFVEVEVPTVEVEAKDSNGKPIGRVKHVKTGELFYTIKIDGNSRAGSCVKLIMQGMLSMLTLFCKNESNHA